MRYFGTFPIIDYDNVQVRNIMGHIKLLEVAKTFKSLYHPLTLKDNESPQKIAYDYYGSTDYTWLIFIVNGIVDPYYDWPLNTYEFDQTMKKKYGSLAAAQSTILYYVKKPVDYYVNNMDPNDFKKVWGFTGDTSKYKKITMNSDVKMSVESYARNPDANFTPVYAYNKEAELNENRRNIKLLDSAYTSEIDKEFKSLFSK